MFNYSIARQTLPRRFPRTTIRGFAFRWRANLRVLGVDEIKTIPGTPRSHAFVERLIGTIRREYLDRSWFWNQTDLERKLDDFEVFTTNFGVIRDWPQKHRHSGLVHPATARALRRLSVATAVQ